MDERIVASHHHPQIVHRGFRLVNENHLSRGVFRNLTHNLRTYGTGSTRDEYSLVSEQLAYCIHIHLNLVARKKVLDFDVVELGVADVVVLSVPGFRLGLHHYLYAGTDELIYHLCVRAEEFGL